MPAVQKRLADIEYDFELALSMIKETGSSDRQRRTELQALYLEEGLEAEKYPSMWEEGKQRCQLEITGNTVDIIPVTNYYVDKSSLDEALAVLKKRKWRLR